MKRQMKAFSLVVVVVHLVETCNKLEEEYCLLILYSPSAYPYLQNSSKLESKRITLDYQLELKYNADPHY